MPGTGRYRKVTTGLAGRTAATFAVYDKQSIVATTGTSAGGSNQIKSPAMFMHVTVSVTTDANDIVILPEPVPGRIVILSNGATGYEVRSSAPSTVGINGGTGASAESAIGANVTAWFVCHSATAWRAFEIASDGTTDGVEAAA